MKKLDILKMSEKFLDTYFEENMEQIYQNIFGGISETDDIQTAAWKMVIDSSICASKISVMTTLCLLIDLGVIDCDDSDSPKPPPLRVVTPQ